MFMWLIGVFDLSRYSSYAAQPSQAYGQGAQVGQTWPHSVNESEVLKCV